MELIRHIFGITTLAFVAAVHMIGFNNIKVFNTFWLPELVLILYTVYSLIPVERVPKWYRRLVEGTGPRKKDRKEKKIVHLRPGKKKKLRWITVLDVVLIALVVTLAVLILYRI